MCKQSTVMTFWKFQLLHNLILVLDHLYLSMITLIKTIITTEALPHLYIQGRWSLDQSKILIQSLANTTVSRHLFTIKTNKNKKACPTQEAEHQTCQSHKTRKQLPVITGNQSCTNPNEPFQRGKRREAKEIQVICKSLLCEKAPKILLSLKSTICSLLWSNKLHIAPTF